MWYSTHRLAASLESASESGNDNDAPASVTYVVKLQIYAWDWVEGAHMLGISPVSHDKVIPT